MDPTETIVESVRDVGPDAIALTLETPDEFDAQPGQFLKLVFEIGEQTHPRFYTISSPRVGGTFETTVGIDPEGDVSPRLTALESGDSITVAGPFGSAYYEADSRSVILAGGPGVGPAVGIAERALADGNEAAIVYRDDEPMHEERLDDLRERGAFVRVLGEDETLTDAASEAITCADGEQVFVYGFADFLSAATDAIGAAGGAPDEAKMENFG
jgi:3-phenylpropionate/trans-cinnamate dioxygenase ferredoxin reductase subunit